MLDIASPSFVLYCFRCYLTTVMRHLVFECMKRDAPYFYDVIFYHNLGYLFAWHLTVLCYSLIIIITIVILE
jgi:hypothetical protein